MIVDRDIWCLVTKGEVVETTCRPGLPCQLDGKIEWRISVMGIARQGSDNENDRETALWIILDDWKASGPRPPWDVKLKMEGDCTKKSGQACIKSGGREDTLRTWSEGSGSTEWITFFSPEDGLTDDKVAKYSFGLTATLSKPGHEDDVTKLEGAPFRCDSATYFDKKRGCVFDDDKPVMYRFDSRPEWVEQADHVWEAQNRPQGTKPSSRFKKIIPGSPQSEVPLERLQGKDQNGKDSTSNQNKTRRQCIKHYGAGYAKALEYDRQCDEYPYASTYQGSVTGAGGSDNDGYKHFSVKPIRATHNEAAGRDLKKFYRTLRILNKEKFYVHLITPSGGDYNGPDRPSGVAAPVQYHQCQAADMIEAKQAEPKAYPEDVFNKYAATTRDGWTGGDSTFSVTLPDGRRLWLFSDTFMGPLNADGTRPTSAPLINSSIVAQVGDNLTTITGGTDSEPEALMPRPTERHWYWLGDGLVANVKGEKRLQVVFHEWHKFGDGDWDFKIKSSMVATFDLNNLKEPESIAPLPSEAGVQWGSAVMSAEQSGDGYTYIYGTSDKPLNKGMRVARVKGTNVADASKWQYLNGATRNWMYGETEGDDTTIGIANEYSVTPHKGSFVLVSQDSTEAFSGKIRMWTGCDPYGPFGSWVDHDEVYRMPEGGPIPFGDCVAGQEDGKCFSYNAHVHPSLATGDRWTLSYNVNNFDNRVAPDGAHYRDPTIYRPRFVSFKLVSTNVHRADAKLRYSMPPKQAKASCRAEHRPRAGQVSCS
ncbi:hypothetical protein [Streptomyces sp. NPDC059063]|uniref:NucA/NucB deoxyribonuclease domain-containing protein n=1 Tax=unclassified Streptomyces TaxID=2593676 RepID=UPI00369F0513